MHSIFLQHMSKLYSAYGTYMTGSWLLREPCKNNTWQTPFYLVSPQYVYYMLSYIAVCGNIIAQYITVQNSMQQYVAADSSVQQCLALYSSIQQCIAVHRYVAVGRGIQQHIALYSTMTPCIHYIHIICTICIMYTTYCITLRIL